MILKYPCHLVHADEVKGERADVVHSHRSMKVEGACLYIIKSKRVGSVQMHVSVCTASGAGKRREE